MDVSRDDDEKLSSALEKSREGGGFFSSAHHKPDSFGRSYVSFEKSPVLNFFSAPSKGDYHS